MNNRQDAIYAVNQKQANPSNITCFNHQLSEEKQNRKGNGDGADIAGEALGASSEIEKAEEELAKYKKLERQLGNNFSGRNNECSFEMLLEATQNGFWYQDMENKIIHLVPDDNHPIVYGWNDGYPILQYMEVTEDPVYTTQCIYDVFVTDYKKKFWLKEDRSE
jgi:hypothetical protein